MAVKLEREKYVTLEELLAILNAAKTRKNKDGRPYKHAMRDFTFLVVCAGAGLRVGEAILLRPMHFNAETRTVRVPTLKRKGHPLLEVPLSKRAAKALSRYIRKKRIGHRERIFPFTDRQGQRIFKTYARMAGLNPKYSSHALRHFRGMTLYDQTKDLYGLQKLLGHSSVSITAGTYVHGRIDYNQVLEVVEF